MKAVKGKGKKKKQIDMPKRIEIMKLTTPALWSWDILVDSCAVCRNSLMECCTECQAVQSVNGNVDCVIAWGVCNHAFHLHCIARWLERRCVCPLDNLMWEYRRNITWKWMNRLTRE
ncbi:RING-box protein 1a [Trichinella pseudospiralis]|uniref:RING-box protein 1a n=1 Tax=Trichinella pseudospiralis TaxID=6337 RepID=A0A0V1K4T2_TRIPS|nr:RING-box protein 1a [Trichinella pseudospiralis]KRZ42249.1 RING-box protein 1a [Trichinella pseudospiralis]